MTWYMKRPAYLKHYGVKGQKWGERRYQNPDGSLTEVGKARYYNQVMRSPRYTTAIGTPTVEGRRLRSAQSPGFLEIADEQKRLDKDTFSKLPAKEKVKSYIRKFRDVVVSTVKNVGTAIKAVTKTLFKIGKKTIKASAKAGTKAFSNSLKRINKAAEKRAKSWSSA